jgi:hypothetical protein
VSGRSDMTPSGIRPLAVKDVTAVCITKLKDTPGARTNEKFAVPADGLANVLVPQENESIFLKLYVTEGILSDGKLELTSTNLFPNYTGRIFEFEHEGVKQLALVGLSNDLDYKTLANFTSPSTPEFPFLVYIPPSPQDTPDQHKKLYPELYAKTAPADVPLFYKDLKGYPYSWDWLYFQFFANMHRISYQLKKANKPYVFVVPQVKSFSDGIGILNSAEMLERCLLGIQKFYLDQVFKPDEFGLADLKHVMLASFSIGDSILSRFIEENRQHRFFRDGIKDLVILDPPFGNPKNRSPIIDSIVSVMRADKRKSVFLYTQDAYYITPLINSFLTPKGIPFDLRKNKIFFDSRVENVFFAYLEPPLFRKDIQDPLLKGVHNTFPNLFINNAVQRSALKFAAIDGKLSPITGFLNWVPTK